MTAPVTADEARAAAARDAMRRVRAMYDAAPPAGCDDGDRTPALERVVASLAGSHSTGDLDPRDVRCLAVAFDDAEQIIASLQGQAALLRGEVNELRAERAQHAAEVAAAVAAERERCAAVCRDIASDASDDDPVSETADACAEAIERADALTAPAATTGGA